MYLIPTKRKINPIKKVKIIKKSKKFLSKPAVMKLSSANFENCSKSLDFAAAAMTRGTTPITCHPKKTTIIVNSQ